MTGFPEGSVIGVSDEVLSLQKKRRLEEMKKTTAGSVAHSPLYLYFLHSSIFQRMERSESAKIHLELARKINPDPHFIEIHGRILDLLEICNPAEFSVLWFDFGAFTRPRREQVVAGCVSTATVLVTIACLKSGGVIDAGQLYMAAANAAGGLWLWFTSINEKIFKDDRPVTVAYLRSTQTAIADLRGYEAGVNEDNLLADAATLLAQDDRMLQAMQRRAQLSLGRMHWLHSARTAVLLQDKRLQVATWCRMAPSRGWRHFVEFAVRTFEGLKTRLSVH